MNTFRIFFVAFLFTSFPVFATSVLPGDLIISEVMANPDAVSDANGEWFELYNLTGNSLNLNGLVLSDNGTDYHEIGDLVIEPFGYLVLGRNSDSNTNGNYIADYEYSSFILGNLDDEIIISNAGLEIVRLEYFKGFAVAGGSQELSGMVSFPLDNTDYTYSRSIFGNGDFGTPGQPGDSTWELANQPVPVPAAVWFFGSGLVWLFGVKKKRPAIYADLSSSL